jgi:hypothetical protein
MLRLERKLSRAKRGSNRRGRVKHAIAELRARETDRRKDWAEKTSPRLAREFDLIRVEDLNIKGMTHSAKGTKDKPGRNVRAKAGLNRESCDPGGACWYAAWIKKLPEESRGLSRTSRASGALRAGTPMRSRVRAKPTSTAWPAVTHATPT